MRVVDELVAHLRSRSSTASAVRLMASGVPLESVSRWCLEPGRARSTGEGPVKPPLKSTDVAAIDHRRGPVDQPRCGQAPQTLALRRGNPAGALPLAQPAMRGRRRAAPLA